MRRYSLITAIGVGIAGWIGSQAARAQAPANSLPLEEQGTLEGVEDDVIKFRDSKTDVWFIRFNSNTKITVSGEAQEEVLRPGLSVQFDAKIDKKNMLAEPLTEIEIYSSHGKPSFGLFSPKETDESAKPARNPGPGSYRIRGKLASFRDGEIVVMAGTRRIAGDIAEKLTVKVNLDDPSVAQVGDKVHIKAWYTDATKPQPLFNRAGRAEAEELTIELANPLAHSGRKARSPEKNIKPAVKSKSSTKS